MVTFLRSFQVSHGVIGGESSPTDAEQLYTSPEELEQLYGCHTSQPDIIAAMTHVHTYTNRSSLWPCEYETDPIEMPTGRNEARLPITPIIKITTIAGRYGQTRRDNIGWNTYQGNIAAFLVIAGPRPTWIAIDPSTVDLSPATGIIVVPYQALIAPFAYIKATYIAGYVTIPDRIKMAIFEIINNFHNKGVSDRISYTTGRVSRRYASDSFMTPQAKALLEPFVIHGMY